MRDQLAIWMRMVMKAIKSDSFVKYRNKKIIASKSSHIIDNWVAYDIESEVVKSSTNFASETLDKNASGGSEGSDANYFIFIN
jgi:hypothetical protein